MSSLRLDAYDTAGFLDEMVDGAGAIRPHYAALAARMEALGRERLDVLQAATARAQRAYGMTFNVYADNEGTEKILHLDLVPRIIPGAEWDQLERGLTQRITAINRFIADVYGEQRVVKDAIVPPELILSSPNYLEACRGIRPPEDVWCHISGSDLIKGDDGRFYVLEDNLRCPSGVSYMLENRSILKRSFPEVFEELNVRPVSNYVQDLREMLESLSPREHPTVVVLTPGAYNSAYFEHSYLAQQLGAELVEGRDLFVRDERVYMVTTKGPQRVDVIYRRVDDEFIDPQVFRADSLLGTPGLFGAFRAGNVALVNAPGTGFADDKAVYAYLPRIIEYYLDEEPLLDNVRTYICAEPDDLRYVLEHIGELVVKQTDASGGYGMLVGPKSTRAEHAAFAEKVRAKPRNYIAQPMINLSRVPTLTDDGIEGRHVDLRPYILCGKDVRIAPGALTRVALKKGSIVVNSSQGGGSKDTWVVD